MRAKLKYDKMLVYITLYKKGQKLKRLVINIKNNIFAQATEYALLQTGDFMVESVLSDSAEDICEACVAYSASILFMDVSKTPACILEKRLKTTAMVKKRLLNIKVALFCDSNANPDIAEQVKNAKATGQIDAFFYESVTANYLVDTLDSL